MQFHTEWHRPSELIDHNVVCTKCQLRRAAQESGWGPQGMFVAYQVGKPGCSKTKPVRRYDATHEHDRIGPFDSLRTSSYLLRVCTRNNLVFCADPGT